MQSKGFVRFIAIFLIIVCVYQLLFTWKAAQVESKAKEIAEAQVKSGDPEKLFPGNPHKQLQYTDSIHGARKNAANRYLDSISNETVMNLLVTKYTYKDCKERQLNLGLDLQGGMSTVLQVSLKDLIIAMSDDSKDRYFLQALDMAEKKQAGSTKDYISLFEESFKEINPNGRLAPIFSTRDYQDRINFQSSNQDVIKLIREESESAVNRTFNIISSRIDQFGVKQPNVTLDAAKGRINVELAGVDNPERVRKLLQATASLEFWETYKATELGQFLNEADIALKTYVENQKIGGGDTSSALLLPGSPDDTASNNDLLASPDTTGGLLGSGNDTALGTGSKTKTADDFRKENPLFAVLQPSVDEQSRYVDGPVIGYSRTIDTAIVNRYLSIPDVKSVFPKEAKFVWSAKPVNEEGTFYAIYAIKKIVNEEKPPLDGGVIVEAQQDINQNGGIVVDMRMNSEGAQVWKKLTGDNVGNHIAIVLDNQVYSAPVVNGEIAGGNSQIEGGFAIQEAQDLANILKAGKLPAPARIVEEELVGPSLGKASINAGLTSILIGLLMVVAFMILYYTTAGIIADLALLFNLFLTVGILASLGATLTLPGIAGIVLTMGMAVDANVIIYERIREELRNGKPLKTAIPEGYKHSLSAIIDGNLTTLITAIILAVFGMGPVLGFATTLIIGIATTLFTAVLISRMITDTWVEKGWKIGFDTPITRNILQNTKIDFLRLRKWGYGFSIALTLAGLASFAVKGFEMGVDFKGGREYKVRFNEPVQTEDVKASLDKIYGSNTAVKTYGASNQVKVTTSHLINEASVEADHKVDSLLFVGLKSYLEPNTSISQFRSTNIIGSTKIEPAISADIKRSSLIATVLSLIAIFLYILFRFRNLGFSVGAVVATTHDAFFVVSIFSIFSGILPFSLEIDQIFIAAILTIIGYSLNDTVVVFDRLRENINNNPKADLKPVINDAINSTLSRTLNTGISTIFTVIILFFFGGETLRGFSFAMLLGILIGTYSSIFIAAPIMYDFTQKFKKAAPVAVPKTTARPLKKKTKEANPE